MYAKIENDIVVQVQPNAQDGFIEVDFAISGQILQGDGSFIDPDPQGPTAEELRRQSMQEGVEIEGVMCSGFKDDQFGLSSIKIYVEQGMNFDFEFKNGNVLNINPSNLATVEAIWLPFRSAHTKVNFQT